MKTNIKMRVTPEQSKKVKEICKANGIKRGTRYRTFVGFCIRNGFLFEIVNEDYWDISAEAEVDADTFIRTNGTCEEEENKESLKLYFWSYKDGNKWRLDTEAKTEADAAFDYQYCGGHKKVFEVSEDV